MQLTIAHLYPELLNLYGDCGNILVLLQRARWRGIAAKVEAISLGDKLQPERYDLYFLGGGADREQLVVGQDLPTKAAALKEAVDAGAVLLAICGGYQLLGAYYRTRVGETIPGVGLFSVYTVAGTRRLEGNIAVAVPFLPAEQPVVGFENHSGQTFFLPPGEAPADGQAKPLGRVLYGFGNNEQEGVEGARYKNAFGTYLHGPLLAKNPGLADYLLSLALARRYGQVPLRRLDDELELQANRSVYEAYRPRYLERCLHLGRRPARTLQDRRPDRLHPLTRS